MAKSKIEITYISTAKLKAYGKNPRLNDGAVDACAKSISEYGFKVPIVVDADMTIIAGHTRLKAAKKLGLKTVPCIIADDLTDEQVRAYRIADNKVADMSIWDNTLLLEELTYLSDFDVFTGFEFDFETASNAEILDEKDNDVITEADGSVIYEAVFKSESKEKIDKIKALWEELDAESPDSGDFGKEAGRL